MKSIYRLLGVAVLGAILGLSAAPATATEDVEDFYDRINDALFEDTDRS